MPATISPPQETGEQRIVLNHVSWDTYERLLADHIDASAPRFTYDQGALEIMSPSVEHERLTRALSTVAEFVAEESGIEFDAVGSTTFRRRQFEAGAEPDACFYLKNAERIRGKQELDLSTDPPPDLVIEIEITNPAVSKMPIYARFGVPEVWICNGRTVRIMRLAGGEYKASERSGTLPVLTASALCELLEKRKTLSMLAWRRMLRDWARERRQ